MFSPTKIAFLIFLCFPMGVTAQLENTGFVTASLTTHHLPLSFEENRSQIASEYDYVSRGPNYALLLNRSSATLLSHSNNSAFNEHDSHSLCRCPPRSTSSTPEAASNSHQLPDRQRLWPMEDECAELRTYRL